jgi:hypothetical protein
MLLLKACMEAVPRLPAIALIFDLDRIYLSTKEL